MIDRVELIMRQDVTDKAGMTIIEILRLSEEYLRERGVESPRLSAEHLLAKACRCERIDLYMRFDERAEEEMLGPFRADIKKRAGHYPLQYLLGTVEFFSLRFSVREGVFIPRPETELLVEWIEEMLHEMNAVRFLEFGAGTGVISGTLAVKHPQWSGTAIEASLRAARLARKNFESLGIWERVPVVVSDSFDSLRLDQDFDLLVSNPPYIPSGAIEKLQREVSKFEPRGALDGGDDGLQYYPLLADRGRAALKSGGLLAMEIGDGQVEAVRAILEDYGYEGIAARKDYNGFDRMMTARAP